MKKGGQKCTVTIIIYHISYSVHKLFIIFPQAKIHTSWIRLAIKKYHKLCGLKHQNCTAPRWFWRQEARSQDVGRATFPLKSVEELPFTAFSDCWGLLEIPGIAWPVDASLQTLPPRLRGHLLPVCLFFS